MPSNRLEVLVLANAKQFNDTLRGVDRQVDDTVGNLQSKMQGASLALAGFSAAGAIAFKSLIDSAAQMEGFQADLERMLGSTDAAAAELQRISKVAANTPFDLPGVVQGSINLRELGLDVLQFEKVAGNLTKLMKKDLPEGALIFGNAFKGNREKIQQVIDSGVIAKDRLEELGAVLKDGSFDLQGGNLVKFQEAFVKAIEEKGDVMGRQAATLNGAVSNLMNTIGQIKAELGKENATGFQNVVRGVTDLLAKFQQLSPATKGIIADTLLVGTVVTGLASVFLGLTATLGPAIVAWQLYQASQAQATAQAAAASAAAVANATTKAQEALAAQAAAAAEVELALALQATAVGEAEAAAATEILVGAEAQLVAATEAAAVAQGNLAAASGGAAAATGVFATVTRGATAAAAAIPLTLGPALVIVGLVAGAFALYTSHLSATSKEIDRQTNAEAHAIQMLHAKRQATIDAADAIREYGNTSAAVADVVAKAKLANQTDLDITKAIAGVMVQLAQAEKDGAKEHVDALTQRLDLLKKVRHELAGTYRAQEAAAEKGKAAEKKAAADREKILADYQENVQHGVFESEAVQLAALDNVLKVIGKNHKEFHGLTLDRVKLARKAAEDEKKAAKEAQEERLKALQHEVDLVDTSTQAGLKKRMEGLKKILAEEQSLTADQKRSIEKEAAQAEQQLAQKQKEAQKKAADEKLKREKENAAAALKLREGELKAASESAAAAQELFREGKLTGEELEKQLKIRNELAAAINLEKAAEEGRGKSVKAKSDLLKAAQAENAAAAAKNARDVQKVRDEQSKRDKQQESDRAASSEASAKREEENLKARMEAGDKVETELRAAMKRRQDAEDKALKVKLQAELIGANQAESERLLVEYQRQATELAARHKEEERAINEELKKQTAEKAKQSPLNLSGEAYGIDKFFADQNFFGSDPTAASKDEAKKASKIRQDQLEAERTGKDALKNAGQGMGDEQLSVLKAILAKMDAPQKVELKESRTQQRRWDERPPRAGGMD